MNRYLNGEPLPWLTDGENHAVTYLAKKEFFDNTDPDKLYSALSCSPLTGFFRKHSKDSILGDQKNFDLFYRGTVWFFLLAVESGYDYRTDFITKTADYICKNSQLDDGGFSFNWNPPVSVGCRTGNIVYGLLKSRIKDERTEAGLTWIIKNQRYDGGWLHCPFRGLCDTLRLVLLKKPGNGHQFDRDKNIPSCPVATFTCLNALIESENRYYAEAISTATNYFLSLDPFDSSQNNKTVCGLFIDPIKTGYPVMSQFDVISVMKLLIKTDLYNNNKCGELFNKIIKYQSSTGRWSSINTTQGMIKDHRIESRWVTLNALRVIKSITEKETQLEKA